MDVENLYQILKKILWGKGKKIIKTCFSPKSIEKTVKAEERNSTLHKGVTAYGYPENKIWDIKGTNRNNDVFKA